MDSFSHRKYNLFKIVYTLFTFTHIQIVCPCVWMRNEENYWISHGKSIFMQCIAHVKHIHMMWIEAAVLIPTVKIKMYAIIFQSMLLCPSNKFSV